MGMEVVVQAILHLHKCADMNIVWRGNVVPFATKLFLLNVFPCFDLWNGFIENIQNAISEPLKVTIS